MAVDSGADRGSGGPAAAVAGVVGGVAWAVYPPTLGVAFRGAAPGQPPYTPETVVYAQLLAVPAVLVLVGVPVVRGLPGAATPWGRRGTGLVTAGIAILAVGVLAVTLLGTPGRSPGLLAAVAPVGLLLLQFGGTFLGYGLWSAGDHPHPEFDRQRRIASGLLLLSLPATLLGIAGSSALYSAVPFYAGVAVPVGLGWAGACYAVLIHTYRVDPGE